MSEVLLEIGLEEIPARFMPKMLAELRIITEKKFSEHRLSFKEVKTLGTDRRLALMISGLSDKQTDLNNELKGPPEKVAYLDGKLTQAGEGFCRKNNIDPQKVSVKEINGANYLYAKVFEKGKLTKKILPELYTQILTSIHLPIAMRWGDSDFQFIRPVHWIVSLYDDVSLPFTFAGIKSGSASLGHRFISPGKVAITSIKKYAAALEAQSVFVDQEIRKNSILAQIMQVEKDYKLKAVVSEEVLNEVTFINECPKAVVAEIDEKYLAVPQECLIMTMQKNQKYFPLLDSKGGLTTYFILFSNNLNKKSLTNIIAGNVRVVTARLEDARFFYEEDQKVAMSKWNDDLKKVTYQEKIGTIYGKVERIIQNTTWLADTLGFSDEEKNLAQRAAELCKADLASKMVYEFPELQGIMGRYYALAAKEPNQVAQAMLDHWKPRYAGEEISQVSKISAIVAIADKMDSIAGCFSVGLIPSSSSDPYALRRAAQGIVAIIISQKFDLNIRNFIEESLKGFKGNEPKLINEIYNFFTLRIKNVLQEMSVAYDAINCVLVSLVKDLLAPVQFAQSIELVRKGEGFNVLVDSAVRVARISAQVKDVNIIEADLVEAEEKVLFKIYTQVNTAVKQMVEHKNYTKVVGSLAELIEPIKVYFDKILVNSPEPKLQRNRLAQVKAIDQLFKTIGDFEKIVI